MESIMLILFIAVIVEALVEVLKGIVTTVNTPHVVWPVASAALGVMLCVLAGCDLFAHLAINLRYVVIGEILTGILVSRGSNFLHDLWVKLNRGRYGDD